MASDYEIRKAKGRAGGAHVRKSNRKKSAALDKLRRECFPNENPPLTEVAVLARNEILRSRIEREKVSGALVSPENLCLEAGNIFLRHAIGLQPGALLELETLWKKFTDLIAEMDSDSAARFIAYPEHRTAFVWQTAGIVKMIGNFVTGKSQIKSVDIVRLNKGRKPPKGSMSTKDGKYVFFFRRLDGTLTPVPKNFSVTWPVFLCPGDKWNYETVKNYSVGNATFAWPPADLEWVKLTLNMLLTWHKKIPSHRARKV
jgi:hypothetical protein